MTSSEAVVGKSPTLGAKFTNGGVRGLRDLPTYVMLTAVTAGTYPALAMLCCTSYIAVQVSVGGAPTANLLVALVAGALGIIAVTSVVRGSGVVIDSIRQTMAFRRWVRRRAVPIWPDVEEALSELDMRHRVVAVDTDELVALTVGFFRPAVVFSTGLFHTLPATQFRSVLAHELAHVRLRDPLRLLMVRVLAAHLWFLPGVRDVRYRVECAYELAADWYAARHYGNVAVAQALLSFADVPTEHRVGAQFRGKGFLVDRVTQLECGQATRPRPLVRNRLIMTIGSSFGFLGATASVIATTMLVCAGCA